MDFIPIIFVFRVVVSRTHARSPAGSGVDTRKASAAEPELNSTRPALRNLFAVLRGGSAVKDLVGGRHLKAVAAVELAQPRARQ